MAVIVLIFNAFKKTVFWTFEVVEEARALRIKAERQFRSESNVD